jgi:3-hydroxymyristoyl/3-hydroxydecanoyl-(acyl carrier protein) dehydratase
MKKLTLQVEVDHPTGAGHFPGNPIIPGALLLAEVLRLIARAEDVHLESCNVKSAKFQHPARPGDSIAIEYTCSAAGVIEFHCAVAGIGVVSGVISATHA